jgi:hypothetical protein
MQPQATGKAKSSVVASLLSGLDDSQDNSEREVIIQNTAGTAYTGGADTVRVALNRTSALLSVLYIDRICARDIYSGYDSIP